MLSRFLDCLPPRRWLYLIMALLCLSMIAYALYLQYFKWMEPCLLCYLQRGAILLSGAVLLVAGLHNPGRLGGRVYAGLLTLTAGSGVGIALRHLYIQNLPPELAPSCSLTVGALLDQMPYFSALLRMLEGSAECYKRDLFLGIPLPGWTLMFFIFLIAFGWLLSLRPPKPR